MITRAYEKTGRQVVVLIDEYDKPLLQVFNDEKLQTEYLKTLKAFYGVLKSADRYLRFVFNPFSLLNTLRFSRFGSYWFQTGTPTFLVELLKQSESDLRTLIDGVEMKESAFSEYRVAENNPIPLIYQSGYLTIKAVSYTHLYQERFSYRESSAEMPSGNDVTPLDLTAVGSDGKQTNALLSLKKGLFVKIYCIANQSKLIDPATDTVFNGFIPLVQSNPGQPGNTVTEGTPTESDFLLFKSIQLEMCIRDSLESMNAELIKMGLSQNERVLRLNKMAIEQMSLLLRDISIEPIKGLNK